MKRKVISCVMGVSALAKTIEPEFQIRSVPNIEERLQSLASTNQ